MIRETHVDHNLNRLLEHFGPRIVGRPPATATDLAAVEALAGPLPRDLTLFLSACDGLRLELDSPWPFRRLWSTRDMLKPAPFPGLLGLQQGFLPVAGCEDAQCDWLLAAPGTCHGAVLRCDPCRMEQRLVASCFGIYFECWTSYAIGHFDHTGQPAPRRPADTFDASYIARHDPALAQLERCADARSILGELHMALSAGADFE